MRNTPNWNPLPHGFVSWMLLFSLMYVHRQVKPRAAPGSGASSQGTQVLRQAVGIQGSGKGRNDTLGLLRLLRQQKGKGQEGLHYWCSSSTGNFIWHASRQQPPKKDSQKYSKGCKLKQWCCIISHLSLAKRKEWQIHYWRRSKERESRNHYRGVCKNGFFISGDQMRPTPGTMCIP